MNFSIIRDRDTKEPITFNDIDLGAIFYDDETKDYYIKTYVGKDDNGYFMNAVRLDDGWLMYFRETDEVEEYKGKIELKESDFRRYKNG